MILGAIAIALAGLVLIYLEFYLPGGIMGLAGGVILLGNIVHFAVRNPSVIQLFILVVATVLGLIVTIKLALHRIKVAKPGQSVYHDLDQEGFRASSYDENVVGSTGYASSNLSPSGYVIVDGERRQAVSQSGFISKDSKIKVIGGQGAHLIVKKSNEEET